MRTQKGITLVALIITIVVLMILAGVAISAIQDNGILGYAENAATSWNEAQKNEAGIISGYEEYLANMGNTKGDEECTHTQKEVTGYDYIDNWTHKKYSVCKACKETFEEVQDCTDYDGNAISKDTMHAIGTVYCEFCGMS